MKYLVLGSSGQIGSALVKYLKNRNEEVVTFDIVANKNVLLILKIILKKEKKYWQQNVDKNDKST